MEVGVPAMATGLAAAEVDGCMHACQLTFHAFLAERVRALWSPASAI